MIVHQVFLAHRGCVLPLVRTALRQFHVELRQTNAFMELALMFAKDLEYQFVKEIQAVPNLCNVTNTAAVKENWNVTEINIASLMEYVGMEDVMI